MEQLQEFAKEVVDRYIKSMGYNPETIDRNKRMAFTKTRAFQNFAARIGNEFTNEEVELEEAMEFPQGDFDAKGSSVKVVGEKKLSKKASVVKELYMKHREVREELYDHEKDDKDAGNYGGKKPKITAPDGDQTGDRKSKASIVMSGGTTLTGQKRDTVEIDPILQKTRPGVSNADMGQQK